MADASSTDSGGSSSDSTDSVDSADSAGLARYADAALRVFLAERRWREEERRANYFSFGAYRRRVLHAPYGNAGVLVTRTPSEASAASSVDSTGSRVCALQ